MHAMATRGAVDVVVEFGLSRWDIAATEIIVTEAGGRCLLRPSRTQAGKCDAVLGSVWGAEQVAELLEFASEPGLVVS
jgi:fructose-1,6-bisphosphatase/inositol monophosphatase family enzyme